MGILSSVFWDDWGFRIEEMELRRLARVESGVEGEGLSRSVVEKLRFRVWEGPIGRRV